MKAERFVHSAVTILNFVGQFPLLVTTGTICEGVTVHTSDLVKISWTTSRLQATAVWWCSSVL